MTHELHIYLGPLKGDLPDPLYLLPVTPEVISITDSTTMNRSRVIGIGEIAQIGSHNLQRFTINSFFPKFYDSFTSEHFSPQLTDEKLGLTPEERALFYDPQPLVWIDRFKSMRDIPLKMVISGINVDENYIMHSFSFSSIGGEGEDIGYSASFIQYKELSIRMVDFGQAGAPIQINHIPIHIKGDSVYTVIQGDTWASISQKTGLSAPYIMDLNGIRNAFFLKRGTILILKPPDKTLPNLIPNVPVGGGG